MASEYSIGVKVTLKYDEKEIKAQIDRMRTAIEANNLKVKINISEEAIKGLEKLAQGAKIAQDKIKSGWSNILTPLETLDTKTLQKTFMQGEDGVKRLVKVVGYLHKETGEVVKITQQLRNAYGETGEEARKRMMESRTTVKSANHDYVTDLKNKLKNAMYEFQTAYNALKSGKTGSFVNLKELDDLKKKLQELKVTRALPDSLKEVELAFKRIKTEAKTAYDEQKKLDKESKKTSDQTGDMQQKIKNGWKDMVTPLDKMSNIKNLKQVFIEGANGAKTLVHAVGELHTSTGKTVIITQELVKQYDKTGKEIAPKMMQSTKVVEKLNQDMINKLTNDLKRYTKNFQTTMSTLENGKYGKFVDPKEIANLQAQFNTLHVNKDLKSDWLMLNEVIKQVRSNAKLAYEANRALNTNTKTGKIDFKDDVAQMSAFNAKVKQMEDDFKLVSNSVKVTKNTMGEVLFEIRQANNETKVLSYAWDTANKSMKAGVETTKQNKIMEEQVLAVKKESLRLQLQEKMAKPTYQPQLEQMRQLLSTINSLTPATTNLNSELGKIRNTLRSMDINARAQGIQTLNDRTQTFGETLARAATKMMVWISVGTVIYGAIQQIKDALNFIKEMDYTFTTLQMEMTNVILDYKELTKEANKFAIEMGSSTQSVADAIKIFGNYNNTLKETMERSKAAVIMSNLTGDSIKNSSNGILAVQMQFKLSADTALHVVDVFSGVARNLQIDYGDAIKEVAGGIERVGAVAEMAGLKFEELASMVGSVSEATRMSGDVIGNAFKTIFSRISNVGDESNPEEFKKIEKSFYNIGVSIKSSSTTIKPMGEIFNELAVKWKTMNDVEKNQIALDAAGVR